MDGENNGKPYFLMDDLGVKPTIFWETPKSTLESICGFLDLDLPWLIISEVLMQLFHELDVDKSGKVGIAILPIIMRRL